MQPSSGDIQWREIRFSSLWRLQFQEWPESTVGQVGSQLLLECISTEKSRSARWPEVKFLSNDRKTFSLTTASYHFDRLPFSRGFLTAFALIIRNRARMTRSP
jgi:hypothetical protein